MVMECFVVKTGKETGSLVSAAPCSAACPGQAYLWGDGDSDKKRGKTT